MNSFCHALCKENKKARESEWENFVLTQYFFVNDVIKINFMTSGCDIFPIACLLKVLDI